MKKGWNKKKYLKVATGAAVIGVTIGVIATGTELGSLFEPKNFMKFENQNRNDSYDYTKDEKSEKKSNLADHNNAHRQEADQKQQEVEETPASHQEQMKESKQSEELKLADADGTQKGDGIGVQVVSEGEKSDVQVNRPSDTSKDTGNDAEPSGDSEEKESNTDAEKDPDLNPADPGNTSDDTPEQKPEQKPDDSKPEQPGNNDNKDQQPDQPQPSKSWEDRQLEPKDPVVTSDGTLIGIQAQITKDYYACGDKFQAQDAIVTAFYQTDTGKTVEKTLSYGGEDGYRVSFSTRTAGTQVAVFNYCGQSVRCRYQVLDNIVTIGYGAVYAGEYYQCDFPGTPIKSISQETFDALARFGKGYNRQPVSGNIIDLKEMHRKMIALLGDTTVKQQFSGVLDGSYNYTSFLEEQDGYLKTMVEGFRGLENKQLKEERSYIYYPAEGWEDLRSRNVIDLVVDVPAGYQIRRVEENRQDFESYAADQVLEGYVGTDRILDVPMGVTKVSLKRTASGITTMKIPQSVQAFDAAALGKILPDLKNYAYADGDEKNVKSCSIVDGMLCSADGKTLLSVPAGRKNVTIPKTITRLAEGCLNGLSEDTVIQFESNTPPEVIGDTGYRGHIVFGSWKDNTICKRFMFAFADECENISFDISDTGERFYHWQKTGAEQMLVLSQNPGTLAGIPADRGGLYQTVDTITSIGADAFAECRKLTDIELGTSVASLQKNSLRFPENIRSISIKGLDVSIDAMAFGDPAEGNVVPDIQIFVPEKLYRRYLSQWSAILDPVYGVHTAENLLQTRESVTYLYEDGIKYEQIQKNGKTEYHLLKVYEPDRTAIQVKEGTTEISSDAFNDCVGLEILYLPKSVSEINENAWDTCGALETVVSENPDFGLVSPAKCGISEETELYIGGQDYQNFLWDQGIVYGVDDKNEKTLLNVPTDYSQAVTVKEGTTTLHHHAFYQCSQMTELFFADPEACKEVEASCFEGCTGLGEADFSKLKHLNVMGEASFKNCTGLQKLVLPAALTDLPVELCAGCENLSDIWSDGAVRIENRAFADCGSLTGIHGMDQLETLGDEVFSCCRSLISVILPDTLKQMGEECFENCISLEKVSINGNLSGISRYCFYGCRSLSEVLFSDTQRQSLKVIGVQAFGMCQSLTNLDLSHMENLTRMGSETFIGCEELTKVRFPEKLEKIPDSCFASCTNLSILEIRSETLPELGANVFGTTMPSFLHLWVPAGQTQTCQERYGALLDECYGEGSAENVIGEINDKVEIVKGVMFELTEEGRILKKASTDIAGDYTVPEDTVAIADDAFENCTQLTGVSIPENARIRLGKRAFIGCRQLKKVTLAGVVTQWEEETFMDCTALENVWIGPMNSEKIAQIGARAFKNCTGLKARGAIEIWAEIKAYGTECFAGCENLDSISLSDHSRAALVEIEDGAFDGCKKLTAFLTSKFSNLETIGAYAFRDCDTLKQPSIPSAVTTLGEGCFMNCDNIQYISFYGPVKEYPKDCFRNCPKLIRTGGMPAAFAALETIGENAYAGCSSLTSSSSWNLGRYTALKEIGDHAFEGCTTLADSTLADTLQRIGDGAFSGCTALHNLHLKASQVPDIGLIDLTQMAEDFTILVPDSQPEEDAVYCAYLKMLSQKENGELLQERLDSETDGAKARYEKDREEKKEL